MKFTLDYGKELDIVKNIIEKSLKTSDEQVNSSLNYLNSTIGKMIRPKLVLMSVKFSKAYKKGLPNIHLNEIYKISAAIEMLHMASLLHDDIVDEAKLRRGVESIQSKYSKEYALYMGDYLMSQCFLILSNISIEKRLASMLARTIKHMCLGEMKQFAIRGNTNISVFQYLKIISKKTAFMFSSSLCAGAIHLKSDINISKILSKIGYYLGMEFQIIDDILDYTGDESIVGKELKKDIACGYYNLPIYYAIKDDEKGDILKYLASTDENSIVYLYEKIRKSNAIEKSKELADKYHVKALKLLEYLPSGSTKKELEYFMYELNSRLY